jgi:hypothetical protein
LWSRRILYDFKDMLKEGTMPALDVS